MHYPIIVGVPEDYDVQEFLDRNVELAPFDFDDWPVGGINDCLLGGRFSGRFEHLVTGEGDAAGALEMSSKCGALLVPVSGCTDEVCSDHGYHDIHFQCQDWYFDSYGPLGSSGSIAEGIGKALESLPLMRFAAVDLHK